jgi:hypothetical protein
MLSDKKYIDERMGPVVDEVSQEMMAVARIFTYHYCRIDFDDVTVLVSKLAIKMRAKQVKDLVEGNRFLYGQLLVSLI